ncbi:MAG: DNA-3-methyladenine glycosylase 2 family protein [Propionibacteriaceae bacterium]|nr:DNA-3-methyladenine glycosylase 2 family protein [Propionibacteriaceae bacterium]
MDFEQRYRAVATRDARFDGVFITAVRSTGIYCRPSCPARTPLTTNVEFYATSAAAHEAGYRACKRCLPDAVPGSPEWNLRSDVAARAMRLIADGLVEREGVPGLSRRLGYTTRHLNRLLGAELGAGPLALARAHRAQTARQLLVATDLPASDIAFASGFGSIRQFNDTIAEVYDRTPSQLRATRRAGSGAAGGAATAAAAGGAGLEPGPDAGPGRPAMAGIQLILPVRRPFDAAGLFAWLAARSVPGVERATADGYARTLLLPGGPATFEVGEDGGRLRLSARLSVLSDLPPLVARVRRLFDLDADPVGIDDALAREPALAGSVRATPGIRLPGAVDAEELLLRALVGQQISVAAARTQLSRLAEALGTPLASPGPDGLDRLFPTPAQVAERGREVLVGPRARIENIIAITASLAEGELALDWADDPRAQHDRLLAVRGIGEWTANYVAMRVLGHPDILPTGDVALRTGARSLGLPDHPRDLAVWGGRVAPWRSYASLHLWRAATSRNGEK